MRLPAKRLDNDVGRRSSAGAARGRLLGAKIGVSLYASRAAADCPSIRAKHVTAHTSGTFAMRLLLAGVDQAVIALWLGHAQVKTTRRAGTRPHPGVRWGGPKFTEKAIYTEARQRT